MGLIGITQLFNVLPALPAGMQVAASKAVRKAAFDIQALAQANAPVDTGFLKASIYVVTHTESTYDTAADAAEGQSSTGVMEPEVSPPSHNEQAYIVVGANYGVFVELGTINMGAQPYLLPAAEIVKPLYEAAMKAIGEKAVAEAEAAGLSGLLNLL